MLEKIGTEKQNVACHSQLFVKVFENIPSFALLLFFVQLVFNFNVCTKKQRANADSLKNIRQII